LEVASWNLKSHQQVNNTITDPKDRKGLIGIINVLRLNLNGNRVDAVHGDYLGECFLFADTSGNTFLGHLKRNRFVCIARNIRVSCMEFLDHNYITFAIASRDRQVFVYNDVGNKLEELKGHKSRVFKIQVNFPREIFLTASKDCIILWNLKTFVKVRTLLPKNGLKFTYSQFTHNTEFLMTRFNVGYILTIDRSSLLLEPLYL